jgi:colicin import membrane protein
MPPRQKSLTRGRWKAVVLSLLLHSCIVAAAVFGWFTWKHTPPVQTLAVEGTIVDESTLKGLPPVPAPQPTPPPPEPVPEPQPEPEPVPEEQGPPKPDPAEIEKRLNEEKEQERLAAEKLEQQKEAERVEAEKQAAAKEAAEKAAAEKAAAEKKAAEKKRLEAEKEKAAAAKKAAEEKAREAREAELRRSLEAEERRGALQNSDAAARWHASIVAKVQRAWIRPPSAQPGIECIVSVTQVPGGEVTAVRVISCNGGDAALRESVEAAVLRASPLPSPPDPALFERNLELTFAPTS